MRKTSSSVNHRCSDRVQLARRREVVAERLLDDQPRPALARLAPLAELVDDRLERGRRDGEVVDAVARRAALLVELAQRLDDLVLALRRRRSRWRRSASRRRASPRRPRANSSRRARCTAFFIAATHCLVVCSVRATPTIPNRSGSRPPEGERVERGEELALGQVAGGAEDDERARLGRAAQPQPLEQRVLRRVRAHRGIWARLRLLDGLHRVPAELVAQRRLHLGGEVDLLARGEAREERRGDHRQRARSRRSPR